MAELKVGSRELKARLGRYMRLVRERGSVTVTEWGKPVARLVPLTAVEGEPSLERRLERLVKAGSLVHCGGARPRVRAPRASLSGAVMLSDLIVEERERHPESTLGDRTTGDPVP